MSNGKHYSEEQIEYLKKISKGRSNKEITRMFNEKFNQNRTENAISGTRLRNNIKTGKDGRFPKGLRPWNKGTEGVMKANSGSFKKGLEHYNCKPVGSERKNKGHYWEIKIGHPDTWIPKHRYLYEKYHNVKLTKDDVILFGDKNINNFAKENLLKINREQLIRLNQNNLIQDHAEATQSAIYLVDLKSKISEIRGG